MDRPAKLPATLEHRSPGRIRLRVDRSSRGSGEVLERVRHHLASNAAVENVRVNARSGSVLVEGPRTESLYSTLAEIFQVVEKAGPERAEAVGVEAAVAAMKRVDAKLGHLTEGRVSLRWLVPAAFISFGIRQAMRQGLTVGTIPWYVLIYYGVDSFLKLYPEYASRAPSHDGQVVQIKKAP